MTSLSLIAQNLADLTSAVGSEHIACLPALDQVEVATQSEDEDSFTHRIFYGSGRLTVADPNKSDIWIYLVTYANKAHELRFVVYENNDFSSVPTVYDAQFLGRTVEADSAPSKAFGNVTINRKMHALAKYYFLSLMIKMGSNDEELKVPFNISKTWVSELKAVCLDFASRSDRPSLSLSDGEITSSNPEASIEQQENVPEKRSSKEAVPVGPMDIDNVQQAIPTSNLVNQLTRDRIAIAAGSPAPSSVTIAAGPMTQPKRGEMIKIFNFIHKKELGMIQEQAKVREKREYRLRELCKLKAEVEGLEERENSIGKEIGTMKTRKRELVSGMTHEEQLDFMFEAGRDVETKRSRR